MKNPHRSFILAACLTPVLALHAQSLLTDFSTAAGLGSSVTLGSSTSSFSVSGGVANYTVPTAGANDWTATAYTGIVGSYTSDWSVNIDVHFATPSSIFAVGAQQSADLGLMVTKTGTTLGANGSGLPTFNAFIVESDLHQNGVGGHLSDIRTTTFVANTSATDDTTWYAQNSNVTSVTNNTVFLSFNAATHTLSASFDADGAANGYSPTAMPTMTVDASTWGMTASDTFTFYLHGNSLYEGGTGSVGPVIAAGQATLDNFSGSGALTAVPEPSTYAAIAGATALGHAAWRRRRTGAAAA